jgi:phosphoribosylglycinamide formyltransferase 1
MRRRSVVKKRVAVLISGRGSNMEALVAAAASDLYPAQIAVVIANRPHAPGLARAAAAGVPTAVVDHHVFGTDREAFERALEAELEPRGVELICLAGFMRLFSSWLVDRWQDRMLNVHPALLPAFKGLDTHARALAAGVRIHGATVHFVVPEMDSGPILAQAGLAVHEDDTAQTLAARVRQLEHRIYPLALKLVAEGRVQIKQGRCVITGLRGVEDVLISPGAGECALDTM